MDREKIFDIVAKCIEVVIRNEGGLKSSSSVESVINWNGAQIREIIDRGCK